MSDSSWSRTDSYIKAWAQSSRTSFNKGAGLKTNKKAQHINKIKIKKPQKNKPQTKQKPPPKPQNKASKKVWKLELHIPDTKSSRCSSRAWFQQFIFKHGMAQSWSLTGHSEMTLVCWRDLWKQRHGWSPHKLPLCAQLSPYFDASETPSSLRCPPRTWRMDVCVWKSITTATHYTFQDAEKVTCYQSEGLIATLLKRAWAQDQGGEAQRPSAKHSGLKRAGQGCQHWHKLSSSRLSSEPQHGCLTAQ